MSQKKQEAATTLLRIFAQHLSTLNAQAIVRHQNTEPAVIAKAQAYIQEHQTENVRLGQVAQAVDANGFSFCKLFKKVAGINFTDYLARLRVDKARNLRCA